MDFGVTGWGAALSGRIILITEGDSDVQYVQGLLTAYGYGQVRVLPILPAGTKHGITRLADQLERLISIAREERQVSDCIVVLHDADQLIQRPTDKPYQRIAIVCQQHPDVKHIQAHDEIEAWILGDEGFCKAVKHKVQNYDTLRQPSKQLASWAAGKTRASILRTLNGKTHSPSLQVALQLLVNAPCTRYTQPIDELLDKGEPP